jgi:serine/threonine-protein kinase
MEDPLIGRVIAGRYRLERLLGTGGVGRVYLARHTLIGRRVAIKILQPERRAQSHLRAWFLREARAANRVDHANIVEIHDFGETEDGLAYIVMELLNGQPLSAVIAKGPMKIQPAVDVLEQICAALARAHDLDVIHRDIKPENIFLIERGARRDFVKILDFGLARLEHDTRLAAPGAIFGTPEYMSPEQARGETATPQSDLYSVGIVFYECVTGQLPFDALNRDDIPEMHITTMPLPPSQLVSSIDRGAEAIIMRLLAKSPRERYRDAHHLLDELKELMRRTAPSPLEFPLSRDSKPTPTTRRGIQGTGSSNANIWAFKAAGFGRVVARASAFGRVDPAIIENLEQMWQIVEEATKLENHLAIRLREIDQMERQSKDFRGLAGRKIEEISRDQSRRNRRIAEARHRAHELKLQRALSRKQLADAEAELKKLEQQEKITFSALRQAAESSGAARAVVHDTELAIGRQNTALDDMVIESRRLVGQIEVLRKRMAEQSDALEAQLRERRNQLALEGDRIQELVQALERLAQTLTDMLSRHPVYRHILEELVPR